MSLLQEDPALKHPIYYEPHPVSPERKAELRAKGYRIVDAQWMPEGYVNPGEEPEEQQPSEEQQKAELRAKLDAAGIKYHHKAGLDKLQELLPKD